MPWGAVEDQQRARGRERSLFGEGDLGGDTAGPDQRRAAGGLRLGGQRALQFADGAGRQALGVEVAVLVEFDERSFSGGTWVPSVVARLAGEVEGDRLRRRLRELGRRDRAFDFDFEVARLDDLAGGADGADEARGQSASAASGDHRCRPSYAATSHRLCP